MKTFFHAAAIAALLSCTVAHAAIFNVKTYGAKGDGSAVDTTPVNNAITAANAAGGGIVQFPAGKYKCGSIHLKSNVTLQLDAGSTILANSSGIDAPESNPFDDYQDFGHSHFHDALIWGENLTNIGITGPGTIDGNGNLQTNTPDSGKGDKAICLRECDGVVLSDFTIRRGGWFAILTNGTNHIVMHDVKILDRDQRDGFNLINAQHVDISNCIIEASDDAMVLKSDFALGRKVTNFDIVVDHCTIVSAENNAVQFGSETVGDFRDVTFSNLTITGAGKAGLGVTSNDGSIIDGVTFSDITMTGCVTPIWLKITNNHRAPGSPPPGRIRNISFTNITSSNQPSGAVTSTLLGCGTVSPAIPIENVVFNNVKLTVPGGGSASQVNNVPPTDDHWQPRYLGVAPSYGFFLRHVKNISFINCQTRFSSTDNRAVVVCDDNGQNIRLDGLNAQVGSSSPYDLSFIDTTGYQAVSCVNTSGAALRLHTSGSSTATITAPPVFAPYSGTYPLGQTVTLTSATSGATLRYTSDGSTPTATTGTVYSGPLTLNADATVRALAVVGGQTASAVNTAIYQVSGAPNQVATPTFSPGGGTYASAQSVTISTTTSGASIRYTTDGSTPSASTGTLYSSPVTISSSTTLKAIAYASGFPDSTVATATYTINLSSGTAWEAESLARTTSGATATTDTDAAASGGSRVTLNATATGSWVQFTLPNVPAGTYSIQLAYKTNANRGQATFQVDGAPVGGTLDQYAASSSYPTATVGTVTIATTGNHTFRMTVAGKNSASSSFTLSADKITLTAATAAVATPTFSPAGGTFTSAQSVAISSTTSGASIRYTTDGSTPTPTTGTLYSGPITVSTTTTLRAIAYASGMTNSAVAAATYTINTSAPTLVWEAESLTRTTSGTSATTDADAAASGGARVTLNATATGSWVQFTLPNVPAGTYSIQLAYKTNANRGQATFQVDGASVGGTLDQYASSSTYPAATVGTVTIATTGNHTFRLTVAGKNSASSSFTLSADKITLVGQ